MDSNTVERAIRPQTITRKNSLFAGSNGGGHTWAAIASLLTTAKMNTVDPHAWLTQTLERIANGWPNREIEGRVQIISHFHSCDGGSVGFVLCRVERRHVHVLAGRPLRGRKMA